MDAEASRSTNAAELLKNSQKSVRKQKQKIRKLVDNGFWREAKQAANNLERSKAAKVVACAHVLRKSKPEPCKAKPALLDLLPLVEQWSQQDKATAKWVAKRSGGYRTTYIYSLAARAHQMTLLISRRPLMVWAESQAGVSGRGVDYAVKRVKAFVEQERFTHFAEVDIRGCFANCDLSRIKAQLGISQQTMDRIVTNKERSIQNKIHIRLRHTGDMPLEVTRMNDHEGSLPEGAVDSSDFAYCTVSAAIDRFDAHFQGQVVLQNYCDNFLLIGQSREDVDLAIRSLQRMLNEHSAGNFVLVNKAGIRKVTSGINFLGYRFQRAHGKRLTRITPERRSRFRTGVVAGVVKLKEQRGPLEIQWASERLVQFAIGQLAQFSLAKEDLYWEMLWLLKKVFDVRLQPRLRVVLNAYIIAREPTPEERLAELYIDQTFDLQARRLAKVRKIFGPYPTPPQIDFVNEVRGWQLAGGTTAN
jgi:hypothetical protein